jgi:hypothetical protein
LHAFGAGNTHISFRRSFVELVTVADDRQQGVVAADATLVPLQARANPPATDGEHYGDRDTDSPRARPIPRPTHSGLRYRRRGRHNRSSCGARRGA